MRLARKVGLLPLARRLPGPTPSQQLTPYRLASCVCPAAGIVAGPIALDTAPFLTRDDAAGKCRYHFFSLPVASLAPTWLEAAERSREWVSVAEAGARLEAWVVKKKSELAEGLALWVAWWEREGRDAHLRQLGAAAADSNK